jgi:two-component system, LytTR family, sensor kinase
MMKINNVTPKTILLHVGWWVFYISNFIMGIYMRSDSDPNLYVADMALHFLAGISYFYFFIIFTASAIFERKRYLLGSGLMIVNACLLYGIQYCRIFVAEYYNLLDAMPKYYFQVHTLVLAYLRDVVQFTGYGAVYWFYNRSIQQQKGKLALEQQKHEMEQESHRMEVLFLKSQINEHFSYNMLSMFHAQASQYSEPLGDGIATLSDLMRYSVSEKDTALVSLDDELRYVQSYIGLNQLRFGDALLAHLQVDGTTTQWQVPHLALMTLVENAFKHGAIKKEPIEMNLHLTHDELVFCIKNRKKTTPTESSTGIGIKNLERRLRLICQDNATLSKEENNDYFWATLKIKKTK